MAPTICEYMGDIYISTPYHAEFITDLKYAVPSYARRWDKEKRLWSVGASHYQSVVRLLNKHFGGYTKVDPADMGVAFGESRQRQSQSSSKMPELADAYATLYLIPNTPLEIVTAIYKYLAKKNHPDMGGDTATMQRINVAYDAIKNAIGR
jgi:hypothetical protein